MACDSFYSYWILKVVLISMIEILILSAKFTNPDLKVIKFLNKIYNVIISVHGITNKILFLDSNYVVDVVM